MVTQQWRSRLSLFALVLVGLTALAVVFKPWAATTAQDTSGDWQSVVQARGLTDADIRAAVSTYMPSGQQDLLS